jgi:hypothetical protein
VRGLGTVNPVAHEQLAEEDECQESCTGRVGQKNGDPAPARAQVDRPQQGIGKMEIGCRHKRNANPLELEPANGCLLGPHLVQDNVASVDDKDKRKEGAERAGNPTLKVVGDDIDQ